MITESTTLLSAKAHPVIKFVENIITPKIEQFLRNNYGLKIPIAEHFQEYLGRMYDNFSYINTLVYHNARLKLKDIYVTQTLASEYLYNDVNENITAIIDKLPVSIIKDYKKILIIANGGMGKSTIMKYMFIDLIDNCINDIGIPIYINLNRLNKSHTILQEIQRELNYLAEELDKELLLKLFRIGGFIFFLDGYDEISFVDKSKATNDLQEFISTTQENNFFIITSRPESSLYYFGDFTSFNILPLKSEGAFELLSKYDFSKEGKISKSLIDLLKNGQYEYIYEFFENPLLVSLLFTAYDYSQTNSFDKYKFIERVFSALFEKHDYSKPLNSRDKRSRLNFDDFDRILRYVGYNCFASMKVMFDHDSILHSISKAKVFCRNIYFSESDFLTDLLTSVPLFINEGYYYRWAHKSFMDYFAARFIFYDTKQKKKEILTAIYNSKYLSKYLSMMELYYDIDYRGFAQNFILPFCKKYLVFRDENIIMSKRINLENIEERIGLLYANIQGFIICEAGKNIDSISKPNTEIIDQRTVGRDSNYNLIVHGDVNKYNLFLFMCNKQPKLFLQSRHNNNIFNNVESLFDDLEPNHYYHLDMSLGINNQKLYRDINLLIKPLSLTYSLNYMACISEINRINNALNDDLDLIN